MASSSIRSTLSYPAPQVYTKSWLVFRSIISDWHLIEDFHALDTWWYIVCQLHIIYIYRQDYNGTNKFYLNSIIEHNSYTFQWLILSPTHWLYITTFHPSHCSKDNMVRWAIRIHRITQRVGSSPQHYLGLTPNRRLPRTWRTWHLMIPSMSIAHHLHLKTRL